MHLAAPLLVVAACDPTYLDQAAAIDPGDSGRCRNLVVASYNIRGSFDTDYRHWDARSDAVATTLWNLGADVIGLQEVIGPGGEYPDQFAALEDSLEGFAWVGEGRDGGGAGEHNPIFYREDALELNSRGTFWLSDTPGTPRAADEEMPWGSSMNRIATWAELDDDEGHRIVVVNSHFAYRSFWARRESAKQIVRFLAERERAADLTLVMGDLNSTAYGKPARILDGRLAVDDLVSTLRNTYDRADRVTINGRGTTQTFWSSLGLPLLRIDHVFEVGASYVSSWEAVAERYPLSGGADGETFYPSDHLPVRVELCY